ncbi:MAG: HAD-IC family P-type ATPase [Bifidobacteriaceae bacterium]|nr:HAD-IC family P-type ATPase [Bifidobacteriaceae bacterium]
MPAVDERGLTAGQVADRVAHGQVNVQSTKTTRTVGQIIAANVFTLFNGIILAAMIVVLLTGRWKDAVFGFVIIVNTLIGVVTELKSKRTLDRLSILVKSRNLVRRDGHDEEVDAEDIVEGDVLWIRAGEQVPADCEVLESWGLELDESMLTGESATVKKKPGDKALSGATAVSGLALARVVAVGERSYAARLTAQAKVFTRTKSDLQDGINTILKFMTFLVVPLCVLLVLSQMNRVGGWNAAIATGQWRDAVVSAVAGVVGMIPEGLVLLTSLNFAIAAMRLARHNTLVQELEAVETLARVDCLNLDKTGTITDGGIELTGVRLLPDSAATPAPAAHEVLEALRNVCDEPTPNITGAAVLAGLSDAAYEPTDADGRQLQAFAVRGEAAGAGRGGRGRVVSRVPFSSSRKWSSADVRGAGSDGAAMRWYMGAPEVILRALDGEYPEVRKAIDAQARAGARVLLLACVAADGASGTPERGAANAQRDPAPSPEVTANEVAANAAIDSRALPVALVVCAESVRPDAERTLAWFREQGVRCRVISGDNPLTVAAIADRVHLCGDRAPRAIDARELPDDIDELARVLEHVDVVGRVLPNQKKAIVQALHATHHTVAMTGDGVNDALALKEADLGIAMGNAASATKAVAQVVLVDSKFSHLPDVVARGRQVMANMERVASLFLAKTAYSALISLGVVLTGIPFPYLPRHITYVGALTIGMPAFILALAPNTRRYIPGFLGRVLRFAIPCGAGIALSVLGCAWILPGALHLDTTADADLTQLRQICVLVLFVLSIVVLARVAQPLRSWRGALVAAFAAAGIIGMLIPFVAHFFELALPTGRFVAPTCVVLAAGLAVFALCLAVGRRLPAGQSRQSS